jgi:hypothetical protein
MKTSPYDGIKGLMQERKKPAHDALRTRLGLFLDVQTPVYWILNYGKAANHSSENPVVSTYYFRHFQYV